MQQGKVKWFNNTKGYGFIRPEEGGEDLFVHYSYIDMSGYKTLKAGQDVSFEIQQAPKGQHAVNVILHGNPDESDASCDTADRTESRLTESTLSIPDSAPIDGHSIPILTEVVAEPQT